MMHQYRYRIKKFFRDKINLFWTMGFPLLLGTFFIMTIGGITQRTEKIEIIPVALLQTETETPLHKVLQELAQEDKPIVELHTVSADKAADMLQQEEVVAILETAPKVKLIFKKDGLSQTVIKSIVDKYLQVEKTLTNIAMKNPEELPKAIDTLVNTKTLTKANLPTGNSDYTVQYFYALVAMAALYGGFYGLDSANESGAEKSSIGARRGVTPTPKSKLVLVDFLASASMMFMNICILLFYLSFILKVNLGTQYGGILLLCLIGTCYGVIQGMLIGSIPKLSTSAQTGMQIGLSMLFSFFAGLMSHEMRYMVAEKAPILGKINPASLIVDSFYALDAYGMSTRYWTNIACLASLTIVLGILCVICMRRKQYASI